MKTISASLKQAFVDGYRAVLVTLKLKDNTFKRYTDHDLPLTVSGFVYTPAPGLKRSNLTATVDDQVSNQEFASAWVDAPEADLLAGKFDNALIWVEFCAWNNTALGTVTIDKGQLGVIQWTGDGFRADVQSHMRNLSRNISFVFTAGCRHKLFSQFDSTHIGACTLNSSSYSYSGNVGVTTYPSQASTKISYTGSLGANDNCTGGVLTFVSGLNAGLSFPIKQHIATPSPTLEFFLPAPYAMANGNSFNITAGCDKTFATCKNKFNNVIHFGGFPHIQTEVTTR
jgi:uncharacterized phage protein (TIGR02218 family)